MAHGGPIPRKDTDFNSYINNAIPYLFTHRTRLQVNATNINILKAKLVDWNALFPKTQDKNQRTSALTEQKNNFREEIEDLLRAMLNDIPESILTEADRNTLHLPERDDVPTDSVAPNFAPGVTFDRISNRMHILRISNPEDPNSKAKPDGVDAVEVHRFIGDGEPAGDNDYKYIGDAHEHLFESTFEAEDQGKRAWYMLRYKSTQGETGPFSEPVSEHIA